MEQTERQARIRQETARRLDKLTATPGAILKWDANGDGEIDDHEWLIIRSVIEAEVVRDLSDAPDTAEPGKVAKTAEKREPEESKDFLDADTEEWDVADFIDPHMDLPVLEVIDARYEVLQEIGRGSQGQTHLGRHRESGNYVALKELSFTSVESWKSLELFDREADVLQTLDHPAIPDFVDSFHVDIEGSPPRFFIAQEFVSGDSLDVIIARGERFDDTELRRFAEQMLTVLGYLHELNPPVIHRDIKPSNIIRQPDGDYALVDFGGVQLVLQDDVGGSTVVGTSGYMPPEQLTGRAVPQSDLYGLGATLVHLVTHVHPSKLPQTRLKLDWRNRGNLSADWADWIDRLLEPVVEDRFESAASALSNLGMSGTSAPRAPTNALVKKVSQVPSVTLNPDRAPTHDASVRMEGHQARFEFGSKLPTVAIVVAAITAFAAFLAVVIGDFWVAAVPFIVAGFAVLSHMGAGSSPEHLMLSADGSFKLERKDGQTKSVESGVLESIEIRSGRLYIVTNTGALVRTGEYASQGSSEWTASKIAEFTGAPINRS